MDRLKKHIYRQINSGNTVTYSIRKIEVEAMDYSGTEEIITILQEIKQDAKGKLDITFEECEELNKSPVHIESIRKYVKALYEEYPHIFYFLSGDTSFSLLLCFANNVSTQESEEDNDCFTFKYDFDRTLKEDIINQTKMYSWLIGDKEENINSVIDNIFFS
jgi:hypothetical protein